VSLDPIRVACTGEAGIAGAATAAAPAPAQVMVILIGAVTVSRPLAESVMVTMTV
jgi:hypothetical protein